jgi:Putative Actinobacterial Holin-X, holin superfamily III
VRSLVRSELTNARREITEKALRARAATAKLAAASVLGTMTAGTSAATLVHAMPWTASCRARRPR